MSRKTIGHTTRPSPAARRSRQAGAGAAQARAPQMVAEVSAALSWALDHAAEYGGDPGQARRPSPRPRLSAAACCVSERGLRVQEPAGAGAMLPSHC